MTHSKAILKALLKFFIHFGLPKELQSDQGTNFTSQLFAKTLIEWGIRPVHSSAYHFESQGALERHHQTLKNVLQAFCLENEKDWDEAVLCGMFTGSEAPTEALGFSPNQLVFGYRVRGPLDVVRAAWCGEVEDELEALLDVVARTRKGGIGPWKWQKKT